TETAAGQYGAHVAMAMDMISQGPHRLAIQAEFIADVQHPRRRHDEMGFHPAVRPCEFEQAGGVPDASRTADADDKPPGGSHSIAPASFSNWVSSPFWCISFMMSVPPMNSPLT